MHRYAVLEFYGENKDKVRIGCIVDAETMGQAIQDAPVEWGDMHSIQLLHECSGHDLARATGDNGVTMFCRICSAFA